jgi:hypothetical protein
MADTNAYAQPDYDDWGWDDYWLVTDWQRWYEEMEKQFGAAEAGKKWLEAWSKQSYGASPRNNQSDIMSWAMGKGLASNNTIKKPGEFIPPTTANEGQVIIDPTTGQPRTVGNQQDEAVIVKEDEKEKSKNTIWLVIGSLVVLMGVTFIVLKVKQNKAQ